MSERLVVRRSTYYDSITLMLASKEAESIEGVQRAFCFMATPVNVEAASSQGVTLEDGLGPNDLVIAIAAGSEGALAEAEAAVEARLGGREDGRAEERERGAPRSLKAARRAHPECNLAFVSVPGSHAAYECAQALEAGLHVFCFSDGVDVEAEVALKRRALDAGLLLMGPDCGTAILDGVAFGFANVLERGPVGIVGASGTGIQQVTCLLDAAGVGISQAIGVGGRDGSSKVGGLMTRRSIELLATDDATEVLVVVSKPPAPEVARAVAEAALASRLPAALAFVGGAVEPSGDLEQTSSLEHAARWAAEQAGARLEAQPPANVARTPGHIRGLFCGGTLCYEAMSMVAETVGHVASNIPLRPEWALDDVRHGEGHTFVDFGADELTEGRAHPMIDPTLRNEAVALAARDPAVGVVLLDVVLGYGAHSDPAAELAPLIESALRERAGELGIVVSLCGTTRDPQGLESQAERLGRAGAVVARSNARAARLALAAIGAAEASPADLWAAAEAPARRGTSSTGVLGGTPAVANVGVDLFAASLEAQGVAVARVDWRPSAPEAERPLAALALRSPAVVAANDRAVALMQEARPLLAGVGRAIDLIEEMDARTFLHAGPPLSWAEMSGPLRGAITGAAVYEGLASDPEDAVAKAAAGEFSFLPCHERGAVGPMAGVVTASMPMWVVENEPRGNRAFATFNEGLGKVLRYGANTPEVLDRLEWLRDVMAPVMASVLETFEVPLDLRHMIAEALQMGDDGHNRNRAGTSLLLRALLPGLLEVGAPSSDVAAVARFIAANDHFFLNLTMPAAKATADAASGIEGSSIVTAMARNGTHFGVRLSGTGDRWFCGAAGTVEGLYLPGYGPEDANPDIGDSTITETVGLGGFAMAAAPAIVRFVGGSPGDALQATRAMYEITWAESDAYQVPALGFRGTPLGIDAREVAHTGVLPVINTGIAHRDPGVGQVGAGLVRPPLEAFTRAVAALADSVAG